MNVSESTEAGESRTDLQKPSYLKEGVVFQILQKKTYCTIPKQALKQLIIKEILVEAAGVEPASENVTGQETTCLFQFMPQALPWDVRSRRSERTRNADC